MKYCLYSRDGTAGIEAVNYRLIVAEDGNPFYMAYIWRQQFGTGGVQTFKVRNCQRATLKVTATAARCISGLQQEDTTLSRHLKKCPDASITSSEAAGMGSASAGKERCR